MNQMTPPPKIEIIPSSAPFSEAQRSWLNGFFAGLLSSDAPALLSAEQGAAVLQGPAGEGDDGGRSPAVTKKNDVGVTFFVRGKLAVVIDIEMLENHGVSFTLAAILIHAEKNVAGIFLAQALQKFDFGVMVSVAADEASHETDDEGFVGWSGRSGSRCDGGIRGSFVGGVSGLRYAKRRGENTRA